jgi:hypothetical protein
LHDSSTEQATAACFHILFCSSFITVVSLCSVRCQ